MYELNKIAFGSFLAQLRREKGMTQKELAACLYVSDKAVSKWERGLSVPDISLSCYRAAAWRRSSALPARKQRN